MNKFLQIVGLIGLAIGAFFLRLIVVTKAWGYIAVPMGAQQLTLLQAYGFLLLVGLATGVQESQEKGLEAATKKIVSHLVSSLMTWGLAYWIFG